MNYIHKYSEENKACKYTNCDKSGIWYRQNTQYADDIRNWTCLCEELMKENDEIWKEMWKDYYSDKL